MRFTTNTGSTFEVDQLNKLIRRRPKEGNPVKTKEDNTWRQYALLSPIEVDRSAMIWWEGNDPHMTPYTLTSFITEIQK